MSARVSKPRKEHFFKFSFRCLKIRVGRKLSIDYTRSLQIYWEVYKAMRFLNWMGMVCATAACFASSPRGVLSDLETAAHLAKVYELPLALVFTGSDWSEESKVLEKKVLSDGSWNQFLVLQVDFPELNGQSSELIIQNHKLKKQYGIETFPQIVLIDSLGAEVSRFGYMGEEAPQFVEKMVAKWQTFLDLKKALQNELSVSDVEDLYIRALNLGASTLAKEILDQVGGSRLLMEKYIGLVSRGLIQSQEALAIRSSLNTTESELQAAVLDFQKGQEINFNLAANTLAETMQKHCEDDNIWKLQLMLSDKFYDEQRFEEALYYAECSLRVAPYKEREVIVSKIEKVKDHLKDIP